MKTTHEVAIGFFMALAIVLTGHAESQNTATRPDSGLVGTIPHYADDIAAMRRDIEGVKDEIAKASDQKEAEALRGFLAGRQKSLDEILERCVEAYDFASELPIAFSSVGKPAMRSGQGATNLAWLLIGCSDPDRFPRNFTKLTGAAKCSPNGAFRLPLASGRYAVFVNASLFVSHSDGSDFWWQFLEVRKHEWKTITPPKAQSLGSCVSDEDCRDGFTCQARMIDGKRFCNPRMRPLPPSFASGITGFVGPPECIGTESAIGLPPMPELQCVEVFRGGATDEMKACGLCARGSRAFKLSLAPGHYVLVAKGRTPSLPQKLPIDVRPNHWINLVLLGAKSNGAGPCR